MERKEPVAVLKVTQFAQFEREPKTSRHRQGGHSVSVSSRGSMFVIVRVCTNMAICVRAHHRECSSSDEVAVASAEPSLAGSYALRVLGLSLSSCKTKEDCVPWDGAVSSFLNCK